MRARGQPFRAFRRAVALLGLVYAGTAAAESAEQITIRFGEARVVRADQPIEHVVVGTPEVLEATRVGPDVVELWGRAVGRSMVLVWTATSRMVFLVTVEQAPRPAAVGRPAKLIEEPRIRPGVSLYSYRGGVALEGAEELEPERHTHRVTAYEPVGGGTVFLYAEASGGFQSTDQDRVRLDSFGARYRDPLWTVEAGEVVPRAPMIADGLAGLRGLLGEYHTDKLRLGTYGGVVPSYDDYLDFDRPLRLGGYGELELAPNAVVGLDAWYYEALPTPAGEQSATTVVPYVRWEPTTALVVEGVGGVRGDASTFRTQAQYRSLALQLGASYWGRGTDYSYPGSPQFDLATATFLLRPSRTFSVWGVGTRSVTGGHAFASESDQLVSDTQMVQLALTPDFVVDQATLGLSRAHTVTPPAADSAPFTDDQLGVQLVLSRRLGRYLGRLYFRGQAKRGVREAGERAELRNGLAELTWQLPRLGVLYYSVGGVYGAGQARGTSQLDTRSYTLRQEAGVAVAGLLATVHLDLTRESVDALDASMAAPGSTTRDLLAASARLSFRPTEAHELRAEGSITRQLASAADGLPAYLDGASSVAMFASYAFYFGGAVDAPSILDAFASEGIRVLAFVDENENGLRDEGEPPQPGLSVVVDDGEKVVTDEDGEALVRGLGQGSHRLQVDINGASERRSGLRFTTASTHRVFLQDGETARVHVGVSDRGRVFGAVFNDLDLDGVQQPGEPGLPGVMVKLEGARAPEAIARTRAGGDFGFDLLGPGTYRVSINPGDVPPDFDAPQPEATVSVQASQITRAAFPLVAHRSIEGVVFVDANNNGVRDPSERTITGAEVRWDGRTVKSNGGGKYLMRRLPAGQFDMWINPLSLPPGLEPAGRIPVTMPHGPTSLQLDLPLRKAGTFGAAELPTPRPAG